MDQHDEATKKFMTDVAGPEGYRDPKRQIVKGSIRAMQALQSPTPGASIGKIILKTGIAALARAPEHHDKVGAEDNPHDIHVLDVYEKLNDKYDQSWWDWEPETVRQTMSHEFGLDLGADGENIVGALQTILNTDFAHESWHVFEKVGHAFNTNIVDFGGLQPMDLDEVALTVAVLQKIRPKKEFEREVCAYMAAVARSNGAVFLPEELFPACAQEKLDEMNNDLHLKGKVKSLWESGKRAHDDAAIGHQLGMLKEVEEYLVPHGLGKADPTNKEL